MTNFYFILTLLIITTKVSSEYSTEDCKKIGFYKENLVCSTCKLFLNNTSDTFKQIHDLCIECCTKDDDGSAKVYPKARLEMCTCKYGAYPQIHAFIKKNQGHNTNYKNLDIKHVRGLDPIIKLIDEDDRVVDELDICKWDTDAVQEFLDLHLKK